MVADLGAIEVMVAPGDRRPSLVFSLRHRATEDWGGSANALVVRTKPCLNEWPGVDPALSASTRLYVPSPALSSARDRNFVLTGGFAQSGLGVCHGLCAALRLDTGGSVSTLGLTLRQRTATNKD